MDDTLQPMQYRVERKQSDKRISINITWIKSRKKSNNLIGKIQENEYKADIFSKEW